MNTPQLSVSEYKMNYQLFPVEIFQNHANSSYLKSMVVDSALQFSDIAI